MNGLRAALAGRATDALVAVQAWRDRIHIYRDTRDWWVGVFLDEDGDRYICPLPTLVVRVDADPEVTLPHLTEAGMEQLAAILRTLGGTPVPAPGPPLPCGVHTLPAGPDAEPAGSLCFHGVAEPAAPSGLSYCTAGRPIRVVS